MDVDVTKTPAVGGGSIGKRRERGLGPGAWAEPSAVGGGSARLLDRHWVGVGVMAAVAVGWYALYSYLRFRQGGYFGWDLGIFDQTVRADAHLHLPYVTSMQHNYTGDPGKLEWTDHFSPILVVLAPLYWVSNSAYNLLFAQAVLFAAAALPVFAFARRRLCGASGRPTAAYLVAAVYLLSWPLQSALAFDFHEVAFAPPLIALMVERADARRWGQAAVAAGLLLLVKEDMGLVVAMMGVWLLIRGERRVGAWFTAAGLGAMALTIGLVIPLEGGSSMRNWEYGQLGPTPGKAALRLLEHPSLLVTELIDPHVKVTTALWLLLPVLFLCLRSWIVLLGVALIVERYFGNNSFYWGQDYHYNAFLVAIIVLAAVDGASKFRWPLVRLGWAVAALVVSVALLPRFPLVDVGSASLWQASASVHAQEHLLGELPEGSDVLMPWPSDPYTGGHVNPINLHFTTVAPEWILTSDMSADVAALDRTLPAGSTHARYVSYASYEGWTIGRRVTVTVVQPSSAGA